MDTDTMTRARDAAGRLARSLWGLTEDLRQDRVDTVGEDWVLADARVTAGHLLESCDGLLGLLEDPVAPPAPITRTCGHELVQVEVNHDHWMGRLAFHLELLLRQHDSRAEERGAGHEVTDTHRSVAAEMSRMCLEDYAALREQQAAVREAAAKPCQDCLVAPGVA